MTEKKKAPALKGKRTYAAVGAIATLLVAQKLRGYMPAEIADLLASEVLGYVELALAAAAVYFRKQAASDVEHTDTQAERTAGPKFN